MIRIVSITALLCLLRAQSPSAHPPGAVPAQIRKRAPGRWKRFGERQELDRAALAYRTRHASQHHSPTAGESAASGAGRRRGAGDGFRQPAAAPGTKIPARSTRSSRLPSGHVGDAGAGFPWMAAFVAAAMLDGAISRVIKSKEFLPPRSGVSRCMHCCHPANLRWRRRAGAADISSILLLAPQALSVLALPGGRSFTSTVAG